MPQRYTIRQACLMLQVDRMTLAGPDGWMARAGMTAAKDDADRRKRWLTHDELRQLARTHGRTLRDVPEALTTRERIEHLEHQVEALRREVEALRGSPRRPYAPVARVQPNLTGDGAGHVSMPAQPPAEPPTRAAPPTMPLGARRRGYVRPSRAKPPVVEGDAPPEIAEQVRQLLAAGINTMPPDVWAQLPRLRAGWIAFRTWCDRHGLNVRAAEQEVYERRRMPEPISGAWRAASGGVPIVLAYSPEQQEQAAAYARTRWQERWQE